MAQLTSSRGSCGAPGPRLSRSLYIAHSMRNHASGSRCRCVAVQSHGGEDRGAPRVKVGSERCSTSHRTIHGNVLLSLQIRRAGVADIDAVAALCAVSFAEGSEVVSPVDLSALGLREKGSPASIRDEISRQLASALERKRQASLEHREYRLARQVQSDHRCVCRRREVSWVPDSPACAPLPRRSSSGTRLQSCGVRVGPLPLSRRPRPPSSSDVSADGGAAACLSASLRRGPTAA